MHTSYPTRSSTALVAACVTLSLVSACAGSADPSNPFGTSPGPSPQSGSESGGTGDDLSTDGHSGTSNTTLSTADDGQPDTGAGGTSPLDDTGPGNGPEPEPTTGAPGETSSASASASAGQTTGNDLECESGPCCDGGYFRPSTEVCEAQADTQYDCAWGTACGANVGVRHRDRHCSGSSAGCDGALGAWSAYAASDDCASNESCSPGDSSCNNDLDCICTYYVISNECPSYTNANGTGAGGGELFEICGTIDLTTGFMTIDAEKYNGTTFGNRPYQVRVSNPADPSCGPNTNYFVPSDENPSGVGTSSLTFDFQSQWLPGQTQKAYCVTASTQAGDLDYDPFSAQQTSWWWSDKVVIERVCP